MLLLFIVMGPVIRSLTAYAVDTQSIPLLMNNIETAIYVLPTSHIDAFAIGSYFALFKQETSKKEVISAVILIVMLGLITESFSSGTPRYIGVGYQPFMEDSYKYIWGYSAVNFAFAFVLIGLRQRILFPLVFENRVIVYLGKISYGIYVYHYCILWFISSFFLEYLNGSELRYVTFAGLSTIIVASLSYELFEKRFIAMKDVIFKKPVEKNQKESC